MAESSNVEGSKPKTVEDLIQLLTEQQRLQQEKFFRNDEYIFNNFASKRSC